MIGLAMSTRSLLIALRRVGASLARYISEVQAARAHHRARFATREERGVNLLREWLSPKQRAQFDAKRYFDVIGCDSRKRYRIHYGHTTNVHEMGHDDLPSVGWCFGPQGQLVVGDVMLAQKIALETYEYSALAVANRFTIRFSSRPLR